MAPHSSLFEMLPKELEDSRWKLFPSCSKKILHIWHHDWVIMTAPFRTAIWLEIWDSLRGILYTLISQDYGILALDYFKVAWITFFGVSCLAECFLAFLLLLNARDGMLCFKLLTELQILWKSQNFHRIVHVGTEIRLVLHYWVFTLVSLLEKLLQWKGCCL